MSSQSLNTCLGHLQQQIMVPTPRRRGRGRGNGPPTPGSATKVRLDGHFLDGEWYCNCDPREQAKHLQVKKPDSENKDRWFYRCPKEKCRFWLWDDDAKRRENGAPSKTILTSEVEREKAEDVQIKAPSMTQRRLTNYGIKVTPGQRRASDATTTASESGGESPTRDMGKGKGKRKRTEDEDEDLLSLMDSDDEKAMAALADQPPQGTTPQTPAATTRMAHGLPTPGTARTLFPVSKKKRTVSFEEEDTFTTPTKSTTQSSSATVAGNPSAHPETPDQEHDPTAQVMSLLRQVKDIKPEILASVKAIIDAAERRAQGVAKGRDVLRSQLHERDSKIARMQETIAALENKDRLQHAQIEKMKKEKTEMKADLMRFYQKH
ncbi:uncharacterized protein F5Z01DRAFT_647132 [Emericellopsis atlantica]|uniref:GRF-type domain-containing protein n=1 Tax=Emericellopsis atlantica TaxID=2614577 RepID=A0A9P7ZRE4_9HYPO|nr:uncharacterized protein F5Z01DRAFT_647132 [Emericellopsis atlantica]KAG9256943.1 hypothetical protein F5Z01DRAFT_647132 [Emericellopsis atlantica]